MTPFDSWVAQAVAHVNGGPRPKKSYCTPADKTLNAYVAPEGRQRACVSGVYVLLDGAEVAYVGQSSSVYSRIAKHMDGAPFTFDEFAIFECEAAHRRMLEARLIGELKPRWNKILPAYGDVPHSTQGIRYSGA